MPDGIAVLSNESDSHQGKRKNGSKEFNRLIKSLTSDGSFVHLFIQIVLHLAMLFFTFSIQRIASLLGLIPKRFYPKLYYSIEEEIVSTSTRVIFTRRKQDGLPVCLKIWNFENICNPLLLTANKRYLIEGFNFNRRCAPSVYLGVTPIDTKEEQLSEVKRIRRGKLIKNPKEQDIKDGIKYALVMRRIHEDLRLDHQIYKQQMITQSDFTFLAYEIAKMHAQLSDSPVDTGKPSSIKAKLDINLQLFDEGLENFTKDSAKLCIQSQDQSFNNQYGWMSNLMNQAYAAYQDLFQQRYASHCIKRCHGDLKTTNLWIEPEKSHYSSGLKQPPKLFAIDCVDFNPDFCYIDTLSDVAMLAIDLEMHLSDVIDQSIDPSRGKELSKHFLDTYLQFFQEKSKSAWPLLEYYMTEKAMVCAYVSILFDKLPDQGKQYLEVALYHAQRLKNLLKYLDSPYQEADSLDSAMLTPAIQSV